MADKSTPPEGDRIAKVLSRRGVASRREAERLIEAGEVTVNGKRIDSPALNVTARDRITVSGHALPDEEPARLWLYYKPEGLVTSASDEKGRDTVFDHLPQDMPRVMSVGRLDLNSEGLLLLTNDGELKRRLELPSTGWLRKYRVRVNGNPTDPDLEPLRKGITVDGERFQPMQVTLDRVQGANAWLTVGLREGKNREIRRAMNAIDLYVNRLIRVSYGPFRLGELQPGQVEEVRPRVLRDQLGDTGADADADGEKPAPAAGKAKPAARSHRVPVRAPAPVGKTRAQARPREGGAPVPAPARRGTAPGPDAKPAAKPAGKAAAKPGSAPSARPAALPRPQRPGDGVRILSSAWTEAVRPRLPGEDGAATAKPRRSAKPAPDGQTRSGQRDGATFRAGPKDAAKPAARKGPAAPKPQGRDTGQGGSDRGGSTGRRPPSGGTRRK